MLRSCRQLQNETVEDKKPSLKLVDVTGGSRVSLGLVRRPRARVAAAVCLLNFCVYCVFYELLIPCVLQ